MAVDFTGLIITASELRQEIGDPSADPTSETYLADATLTNLIGRFEDIAENLVNEQIANMTLEQLVELGLHMQAAPVSVSMSTGDTDYPNTAVGSITSTYIPIPLRVVDQTTGNELSKDEDIMDAYAGTNGIFTPKRYAVDGTTIIKLPANANTLSVKLVTIANAEDVLKGRIIQDINAQIVAAARRMVADRRGTAASFREENKIEAP